MSRIPRCRCGLYAVGECVDCDEPLCGDHGEMLDGSFHCPDDAARLRSEELERTELEQEQVQSQERARRKALVSSWWSSLTLTVTDAYRSGICTRDVDRPGPEFDWYCQRGHPYWKITQSSGADFPLGRWCDSCVEQMRLHGAKVRWLVPQHRLDAADSGASDDDDAELLELFEDEDDGRQTICGQCGTGYVQGAWRFSRSRCRDCAPTAG